MPDRLYAVTIHQPWAYWIATGVKVIENRTWAPEPWMLGKPLAIHAGKTFDPEGEAEIREKFPALKWPAPAEYLKQSAIIAVVELAAVILRPGKDGFYADGAHILPEKRAIEDRVVSKEELNWFVGDYGWVLRQVVKLPNPVPCGGRQKLWWVGEDILPFVRDQFAAGRRLQQRRKAAS